MENKKQPEVRFPDFYGDWEQRELSELYKKNVEKNNEQFDSRKTISIAAMRFKPEGNGAAEKSLKSYKVLRLGDVAFEGHKSKVFSYGRFVLNDIGDGIMSPRFTTLRPKINMYIPFWKQYIIYEPIMKHILVKSTKLGTMMNELVLDDFFKQKILVPSDNEQIKIGNILKQLDDTINLHQQELAMLKEIKQGFLQKMFPKEGEKVPEVRFPGFTDEWKQHRLNELTNYSDYRGKSPRKTENGIQLITASNIRYGYIDYNADKQYVSENNYSEIMRRGLPKIGDVLFTTEAPLGNVAQVDYENIALAQRVIKFSGKNNVLDNDYLFEYLVAPTFQKEINRKASGGTVKGIKGKVLHQILISHPSSINEQVKIGKFLKQLDEKIFLHQRELELLKLTKKAFLQKLFV